MADPRSILDARAHTRRRFLQAAGLGVGAVAASGWVSACGGSGASSSAPVSGGGSSVPSADMTMWWWGAQNYPGQTRVYKALIAEYQKEQPGTTITQVLQGTNETISAYEAAVKAGTGPDIGTLWYGAYMMPDVWQDNVAALSDYVPSSETDHWLERKFNSFDGKIWAAGVSGDGANIIYNKQHFAKAGLDPDVPPKTWDDLMAAVSKLKGAGYVPIGMGTKDGWAGVIWLNFVGLQVGADVLKDACTGKISWTDPRLEQMWDKLVQLKMAGAFNSDVTSLNYSDPYALFNTGKISMAFNGAVTPTIDSINKLGADKAGVMPMPDLSAQYPGGFIPGMPLSELITPFSKNKQAAGAFLAWLHQPKAQKMMFQLSEGVMMPVDDRFDFTTVEPAWQRTVYGYILEGMRRGLGYADGIVPYDILSNGPMKAMSLTFSSNQSAAESSKQCQSAAQDWQKLNPQLVQLYNQWTF